MPFRMAGIVDTVVFDASYWKYDRHILCASRSLHDAMRTQKEEWHSLALS
jgi:hypothetical protein